MLQKLRRPNLTGIHASWQERICLEKPQHTTSHEVCQKFSSVLQVSFPEVPDKTTDTINRLTVHQLLFEHACLVASHPWLKWLGGPAVRRPEAQSHVSLQNLSLAFMCTMRSGVSLTPMVTMGDVLQPGCLAGWSAADWSRPATKKSISWLLSCCKKGWAAEKSSRRKQKGKMFPQLTSSMVLAN